MRIVRYVFLASLGLGTLGLANSPHRVSHTHAPEVSDDTASDNRGLIARVSGPGTLEWGPEKVPGTDKDKESFKKAHVDLFRAYVSDRGTLELKETTWFGDSADRKSGKLTKVRLVFRHSPSGDGPGILRTLTATRRAPAARGGDPVWEIRINP